jgi:hypothetical protein
MGYLCLVGTWSILLSEMAWRGRGRSGAMMTHNSEAAKEARDQPDPEMFPARLAIHEIALPPPPTVKELRVLENMRRLNNATLTTPYRLKYTVHSNSVDHNIDRYSMRVSKQAPPASFQLGAEYHPAELMQICSKKRRRRYDDDARVLLQRFQEDHEDDLAVGAEDEDGEGAEAEKNEGTDDGNSSTSERDAVSIFHVVLALRFIFQFVFSQDLKDLHDDPEFLIDMCVLHASPHAANPTSPSPSTARWASSIFVIITMRKSFFTTRANRFDDDDDVGGGDDDGGDDD